MEDDGDHDKQFVVDAAELDAEQARMMREEGVCVCVCVCVCVYVCMMYILYIYMHCLIDFRFWFTHTNTHTCIGERQWHRQNQSIQRRLPQPSDVNTAILRGAPHRDQKYRDLYEVL